MKNVDEPLQELRHKKVWPLIISHFRILPFAVGLLPRVDLLGRAFLYSEYNAFVHDKRRPILEPAISDEIRAQQDETTSRTENRVCLVAQHRDESAAESHVFEGENNSRTSIFIATSVFLGSGRRWKRQ